MNTSVPINIRDEPMPLFPISNILNKKPRVDFFMFQRHMSLKILVLKKTDIEY